VPLATKVQRNTLRRGLSVDVMVLRASAMLHSLPISIMWNEGFDVGLDTGTPVDDSDYQVPFRFTGKIDKLTVKLGPEQLAPADKEKVQKTLREHD
jgi:hypothetical protein